MKVRTLALILTLALGLLAAPLPAEAQQAGKVYRIGWLGTSLHVKLYSKAFLEELRDLGWIEGQHFVVEYRSPKGKFERLPALAAELVDLKVDVILSVLTVSTRAAKDATTTIPIVFTIVADPVGSGFVTSLARRAGM